MFWTGQVVLPALFCTSCADPGAVLWYSQGSSTLLEVISQLLMSIKITVIKCNDVSLVLEVESKLQISGSNILNLNGFIVSYIFLCACCGKILKCCGMNFLETSFFPRKSRKRGPQRAVFYDGIYSLSAQK